MARIRIILEDDDGREMADTEPRVYELGRELGNLHEIEGGLELWDPHEYCVKITSPGSGFR